MAKAFEIRLATPTDAVTIGGQRARMFREMGDVPEHLFEVFCNKSSERLFDALASGEYVGWLASTESNPGVIVGGAGVHLRRALPHPVNSPNVRVTIAEGRHAVIQNVFIEPEWRRRGVATLLVQHIIDWAREQQLDRLVLHASEAGRDLYQRLGFVTTNEMRLAVPENDRTS